MIATELLPCFDNGNNNITINNSDNFNGNNNSIIIINNNNSHNNSIIINNNSHNNDHTDAVALTVATRLAGVADCYSCHILPLTAAVGRAIATTHTPDEAFPFIECIAVGRRDALIELMSLYETTTSPVEDEDHNNNNNNVSLTGVDIVGKGFAAPTRTCSASVTFRASPGRSLLGFQWSEITNKFFTYPYKIFLPRSSVQTPSPTRWIYPIVYGGGLVSGDSLNLHLTCAQKTSVLLTSQAFNKVYKARANQVCYQTGRFEVQQGALLSVLPDFIVCYAGARYSQDQSIYLESEDSNLIYLDWYSSGRIANQERWNFSYLHSTLRVYLRNELILREATTLEDVEGLSIIDRMDHFDAFGILVLFGSSKVIADLCDRIHADLSQRENYGVAPESYNVFCSSRTSHGVCVVRFACSDSRAAYARIEKALTPLFELYGGNPFQNKY